MHAYQATGDGLTLAELVRPRPGFGEVAIDVSAIALNRGECRRALQGGFPAGTVPGWDTAGTISELGPGTRELKIGDRVVARGLAGGWAQCRIAHQDDVAIVPQGVQLGDAATLATAATTALAVLTRSGPLLGRTALITAASGSVGQFAIQLARLGGAHVVAATRSAQDHDLLAALGAHEVVTDLAHAPDADLIVESLGGPVLVQAIGLLKPGGVLQSFGWSAATDAVFPNLDRLVKTGGTLQGFAIGERRVGALLAQLLPLLQDGSIKTSVQLHKSWTELPAAAAAVLQRGFHGKAVLDVAAQARR